MIIVEDAESTPVGNYELLSSRLFALQDDLVTMQCDPLLYSRDDRLEYINEIRKTHRALSMYQVIITHDNDDGKNLN